MMETRGDTSFEDTDAIREISVEELGLVALYFPVLDGNILEVGVQFDRLVGSRAGLILRDNRPKRFIRCASMNERQLNAEVRCWCFLLARSEYRTGGDQDHRESEEVDIGIQESEAFRQSCM